VPMASGQKAGPGKEPVHPPGKDGQSRPQNGPHEAFWGCGTLVLGAKNCDNTAGAQDRRRRGNGGRAGCSATQNKTRQDRDVEGWD
jgi:hypothetical protein